MRIALPFGAFRVVLSALRFPEGSCLGATVFKRELDPMDRMTCDFLRASLYVQWYGARKLRVSTQVVSDARRARVPRQERQHWFYAAFEAR